VPVVDPFYFSTLADLFSNSVQRVAYNAVNTAYACFPQDGDKGCSNGARHIRGLFVVYKVKTPLP